jgi:hyperosmotically inducible periplasmic protein
MSRKVFPKLLPGVALGLALAGSAFAQSATQSMKNAGNSAGNAVGNAWEGTKTAVKDTDITAKVKMELHNDKLTKGQDIHVTTNAGVVTLTGRAPSEAARRAARIAHDTTGVVSVNNVISASNRVSSRY